MFLIVMDDYVIGLNIKIAAFILDHFNPKNARQICRS